MRSSSKSEMHKTLVEALDYRRMPLVKYRQYVNNPTISAGSPIVKIITRSSSIAEIRISASSGEYSVCWMKPYEAGILEPQKTRNLRLIPFPEVSMDNKNGPPHAVAAISIFRLFGCLARLPKLREKVPSHPGDPS